MGKCKSTPHWLWFWNPSCIIVLLWKWIWVTQSLLRDPEAFGRGWIKTATEMLLPAKSLPFRWGYWDNGKILNLKSIPECATLKINLIHPFPHLHFFSFLRSQKNWAHKLKCPFSHPNLCNQHLLNRTPGFRDLDNHHRGHIFTQMNCSWRIISMS